MKFTFEHSPVPSRHATSLALAVHFLLIPISLLLSPCVSTRRYDLLAPLALSDIRHRRRHRYSSALPSQQSAGTHHSATAEPERDATSSEDGERGVENL